MTAEFARIGVAFERVEGIDARARPDLDQMPQKVLYTKRLRLTGGEIACLLSHRACWMMIAGGDDPYVAIFEDDVVFSDEAGALLGHAGWIPADADIVKLETFFRKTMIGRKRIVADDRFSLSRLYTDHTGTGGYIISKQTARDLIEASKEIRVAVDDLVFNPTFPILPRKTIYQLVPALCAQDHLLGDRAIGLPSLLKEPRDVQWAAIEAAGKPRKTVAGRMKVELARVARHIVDFCRLRRQTIVPFGPSNAKE
ncbi:glycosyltransferase family 25 protein [Mesorhizobium sp.]|uniref:glycosyltransferase family 25 protein n=1 Tax=Mesorhizobium sp. TaxID=1871066 RepID=UPI003BAC096B